MGKKWRQPEKVSRLELRRVLSTDTPGEEVSFCAATVFRFAPILRRVPSTDKLGEDTAKMTGMLNIFPRGLCRQWHSAKKRRGENRFFNPIFAGCYTRRNGGIGPAKRVPLAGAAWPSVSPTKPLRRVLSRLFADQVIFAEIFIYALPAKLVFAEMAALRRVPSAFWRRRSSSPRWPRHFALGEAETTRRRVIFQ